MARAERACRYTLHRTTIAGATASGALQRRKGQRLAWRVVTVRQHSATQTSDKEKPAVPRPAAADERALKKAEG
jgi:hypothetical protein